MFSNIDAMADTPINRQHNLTNAKAKNVLSTSLLGTRQNNIHHGISHADDRPIQRSLGGSLCRGVCG